MLYDFGVIRFWRKCSRSLPSPAAFLSIVAGQFALMKGYGRNPAVNGALAAFWRLTADRAWCPEFYRVPSASNVSEATSRAMTPVPGVKATPPSTRSWWSSAGRRHRLRLPPDSWAAFRSCQLVGVPARCGRWVRRAGAEVRTPAPAPVQGRCARPGAVPRYDQKGATAPW